MPYFLTVDKIEFDITLYISLKEIEILGIKKCSYLINIYFCKNIILLKCYTCRTILLYCVLFYDNLFDEVLLLMYLT